MWNQHINIFYLCYYLNTPYLIYIIDSLTSNSLPTTHITYTWMKLTYFLHNQYHSLALGNGRQYFSIAFGDDIKQWSHLSKEQNVKHMALSRPWKGYLFIEWEPKKEVRLLTCSLWAGNVHIGWLKFFTTWRTLVNNHESIMSIDFRVT